MSTVSLPASSPFWTPLFALDRLNSWLRSDTSLSCPLQSALKATIYWTKTKAILDSSKRWHIGMRRVMVKKPCRRCDGSGTWIPWWGDCSCCETSSQFRDNHGEPCRGCRGTGTATLHFIETAIGPIHWHTPADKWYMSSLDVYVPFPSFYCERDIDAHYDLSDRWEPLQKGHTRTVGEVERDMRILLHAFPHEVCFALDFHHHLGCSPPHHVSIVSKAEQFLRELFEPHRQ